MNASITPRCAVAAWRSCADSATAPQANATEVFCNRSLLTRPCGCDVICASDTDRDDLIDHLAVERHIVLGRSHLARQEALIAELDRDGHDTTDAIAILATLRSSQGLLKGERERILRELKDLEQRRPT